MKDRNMDYICPICFDLIRYTKTTRLRMSPHLFPCSEAHITKCGHTFCYSCLLQTIEQNGRLDPSSRSLQS